MAKPVWQPDGEQPHYLLLTLTTLLTTVCIYYGWQSFRAFHVISEKERRKRDLREARQQEVESSQSLETAAAVESKSEKVNAAPKTVVGEPTIEPKAEGRIPDIEDFPKSLVRSTMKQLKASGVSPYTLEERKEKIAELNSLTYPNFRAKLTKAGKRLDRIETVVLQANIGLYCNQACTHCHVDSSPVRKEMMNRETTDRCLHLLKNSPSVKIVDLTGGAPELNREFRHWVTECRALDLHVIDRCNLTVLMEPGQANLASFLADNQVHVIASLPCYLEDNVDTQRGNEVFKRSIAGLRLLNSLGYGVEGSGLQLDLVYNPTGVHLPPPQEKLEPAYKTHLGDKYGISFNTLFCFNNMPINRFHDHLKDIGKLETYMDILVGD